ncbi:MAG TPA: glycoside hydrolase family 3 C-terminal domain-containing protein [Terracidiphilus sp.]|nr:glycoside hydrolase family 3 C-terminal domain-containing protein [Terracidiphilus sp.]
MYPISSFKLSLRLGVLLASAATAVVCAQDSASHTQTAGPAAASDARVDKLLSRMTLDEKIAVIHGEKDPPEESQGQAGYMAGDSKHGIPWLRLADGPPGVLTRQPSTAPTGTMGLGATFSREDARLNGVVIGRDSAAAGVNITLQPFINIMRDPVWSRAYDLFGEDPLLVGAIGAAQIDGIQSQGVMAEAKHYVAYNGGDDVVVGQQALHEIYAAPFADAVKAGVASIMCSYNKVNGAFACGNPDTLQKLLKLEIGFNGFVVSDWGANHAPTFINAGLDLEMAGYTADNKPCFFCPESEPLPLPPPEEDEKSKSYEPYAWPARTPEEPPRLYIGHRHYEEPHGMIAAVQAGQVNPARITEAARRILTQEDRFGWLDKEPKHNITPVPFEEDVKIIEKTAEDAAVLLKNQDHALPITSQDVKSLAIIGPGAGQTITIGLSMEKAVGIPGREPSPLAALQQATQNIPDRHIVYAVADDMTGTPIPAALFSHAGQPGIAREDGKGQTKTVDPTVDFTIKSGHALPTGSSFTWGGTLEIPETGTYWIYLQLLGCSAQLKIDDMPAGNSAGLFQHGDFIQPAEDNVLPTTDTLDDVRRAVHLTKGPHSVVLAEQGDASGRPVQIRLNWMPPAAREHDYQAALDAARQAKKVIVFAWARGRPDYDLPGDQNQLIEAITKINPNTIVVLNNAQPIALRWLNQVKAVLEMWYPGDAGGAATANVLLGRKSPAGRLPFTWAERLDQYVSHDPAHPERSSEGLRGKTTFSEGIFVGYRWFDKQNIEPLFPFGYGLSYTKFAYSQLKTARTADGGADVSFTIQNTGTSDGDEVPQVYLDAPAQRPDDTTQFAVRALAAFDRVHLKAGESRDVTLHIAPRAFEYWSTSADRWQTASGPRKIHVGASSRDLRLDTELEVRQ